MLTLKILSLLFRVVNKIITIKSKLPLDNPRLAWYNLIWLAKANRMSVSRITPFGNQAAELISFGRRRKMKD